MIGVAAAGSSAFAGDLTTPPLPSARPGIADKVVDGASGAELRSAAGAASIATPGSEPSGASPSRTQTPSPTGTPSVGGVKDFPAGEPEARVAALPNRNPASGSAAVEAAPRATPPSIGVELRPPTSIAAPTPGSGPSAAAAADAEIARMPWLLRKLTGDDEAAPSVKMDPPRPPRDTAVPPSLRSIERQPLANLPAADDGWTAAVRAPLRDVQPPKDVQPPRDLRSSRVETHRSESRDSAAATTRDFNRSTDSNASVQRSNSNASDDRSVGPGPKQRLVDPQWRREAAPASPETSVAPRGPRTNEPTTPSMTETSRSRLQPLRHRVDAKPLLDPSQDSSPETSTSPAPKASPPSARGSAGDLRAPSGSTTASPQRQPESTRGLSVAPETNGGDPTSISSRRTSPGNAAPRREVQNPTSSSRSRDVSSRDETARLESSTATTPRRRVQSPVESPSQTATPDRSSPDRGSPSQSSPDRDGLDYTGVRSRSAGLTRSTGRLQNSIRSILNYFYTHPEVAPRRSNWGMMHALMVYGVDTRVIVGRQDFSTIAWIAGNNACRGQRLFDRDADGIVMKSGPGLQGHQAQWLAVLSICEVPRDYPIYVDGEAFSVDDIIRREMLDCRSGEELTFTLIALSHYLDTDETWLSKDGERWSLDRLIKEELSQPIVGAACGGTHRLMAFAHALRQRRIDGRPIDGQWSRAQKFTDDFIQYAYRLQNRDGSFSTDWFEGREDNGDRDRKIQTTGHIVEWLLTVTPDAELQDPRLVAAINYLTRTIGGDIRHDWSIGPKGHALRSLAMFYERVYKVGPAWSKTSVAQRDGGGRR